MIEAISARDVSVTTQESLGELKAEYTATCYRRFDLVKLKRELFHTASADDRRTVAFVYVFSNVQKDELER